MRQYYSEDELIPVNLYLMTSRRKCGGVGPNRAYKLHKKHDGKTFIQCLDSMREVTIKAACPTCKQALVIRTPDLTVPCTGVLTINKEEKSED